MMSFACQVTTVRALLFNLNQRLREKTPLVFKCNCSSFGIKTCSNRKPCQCKHNRGICGGVVGGINLTAQQSQSRKTDFCSSSQSPPSHEASHKHNSFQVFGSYNSENLCSVVL